MASHPTALPAGKSAKRAPRGSRRASGPDLDRDRLSNVVEIAQEKGLLKGRRTMVIRGRMPEELVAEAKRKTGITSDSKLLETALANIAAADDYADWLFSQRGTVDPALDLEF
jgi:hypothetical protein